MPPNKPYEFVRFGAMEATKPYEFIGFGTMDATKPYEFIGFGAMNVTEKLPGKRTDTTGSSKDHGRPDPPPGAKLQESAK